MSNPKACSVAGCCSAAHARGFCITHYSRLRLGKPLEAPVQRRISGTAQDRFEAYVEPELNSGCHLWSGTLNDAGYGILWIGQRLVRAHRFAFAEHHGPIPSGMNVCHRCDTPACVNPDHLFLGTQAENMADMVAKARRVQGRVYRGVENSQAKLTEADARRILEEVAAGRPVTEVANDNGVSRTAVNHIIKGRNWSHLQSEAA